MFKKNFIQGLQISLGIILGLSLFFGIVYAVGFHSASDIIGGTFQGNYTFNGSMNFTPSIIYGINTISPGMILTYNSTTCPSGWSFYGADTIQSSDSVPVMTDYSTGGTVTTDNDANGAAWRVFSNANEDGNAWNTVSDASTTDHWVTFQFTNNKTIGGYSVKVTSSYPDRGPKSWNFEVWDGSSYITLDTQTEVSAWSSGEERNYQISSSEIGNYSKYRFYSLERQGGTTLIVEELEFFEFTSSKCKKD